MPSRSAVPGPPDPDAALRAAHWVDLPAVGEGEGVLFVVNASAGAEVLRADPLTVIAERLPQATIHQLGETETPAEVVDAAVSSATPPRVLAVSGGDGSVSAMADLARHHHLPLLIVPGGTFNHFARAAGISSPDIAVDAAQAATGIRVAVGHLEQGDESWTVTNVASVGVYPDVIAARERHRRRWGKWAGGIVAAREVMRRAQPIDVEVDGVRTRVWSIFVSIGRNLPGRVATMQRVSFDDDRLDIRILGGRASRAHAFTSLAFGHRTIAVLRALRLMPEGADVKRLRAETIEIVVHPGAGGEMPFAHDGELQHPLEPYTLRCTVVPAALDVYAMRPAES
jgi:diacylglycerol kinase family enzyme